MLKREGREVCLVLACLLLVVTIAVPAQAEKKEQQWACQLMLDGPPGLPVPLADYTTFLGVMAGRGDGCEVDLSDSPNPPPPPEGDYVDAYWDHTGIVGCPPEMQKLAQDWRSPIPPGGSKEWEELCVAGTQAGTYALSWVLGAGSTDWEPPSYYSFTLYDEGELPDPDGGTPIDMRTNLRREFDHVGMYSTHYFHIVVTDMRRPLLLEMTQPLYSFTYGEMSHVQATARDAASGLPTGCLIGVRYEWDFDSDGVYDDHECEGVDNDCDSIYDGDTFLDVCAGTYSVRARFDGDETYLPAVSAASEHQRKINAASLLPPSALVEEEYSDPLSVRIELKDEFGNPLRHVGELPPVRAHLNGTDDDCDSFFDIFIEVTTGGSVVTCVKKIAPSGWDVPPGTYTMTLTWPGDCHYSSAQAEKIIEVKQEELAPEDVPGYPHLAATGKYWEEMEIRAHRVDNDGEELYHLDEYPVLAMLSTCSPVLGICMELETSAGMPDTIVTFAKKAAEKLWGVEEVRQASGLMPYKLRYHGSPYYEEKEEEATWTIIPDQMTSPLMDPKWRMISVPGNPVDPDPLVVFAGIDIDMRLWKWDPVGKQYIPYDALQPGGFGFVEPMDGYWFNPLSQCSYSYPGYLKQLEGDKLIQAQAWHLIGNPHIQASRHTDWEVWNQPLSVHLPWAEAVAAGWVSNPLYTWGGQQCQNGYCTIGIMPWDQPQLDAYQGAWMYSFFDIYLEVSTD